MNNIGEIIRKTKNGELIRTKTVGELIKSKKMMTYLAIAVLLISGIILSQNIGPWAGDKNNLQASADRKVTVEVRQAERKSTLPVSTYDATLLAGEEGMVGADVPGKVVQILFQEGDIVKKGEPLIVLDSGDMNHQLNSAQAQLTAAQASLPKAEANVEISKRNFDNAKALFEVGALAKNDLSDAETALKVAQADLSALQSNIAAAQAGVNRLKYNLANMVIKAPVDGVVEDKNIILGAYVAPGVPLAMVKNISTIQAMLKIPQEDGAKVQVGQKARVTIHGDDQVFEGTVTYVSTAASMASRTFMAKVEVENKDNRLKSGMYASVDIVTGNEESVLLIPLKAVAGSPGSYYVFTDDNGKARRTEITLGTAYEDMIQVKTGLTDGTGVICSNINSLQDGDLITSVDQVQEETSQQPWANPGQQPTEQKEQGA